MVAVLPDPSGVPHCKLEHLFLEKEKQRWVYLVSNDNMPIWMVNSPLSRKTRVHMLFHLFLKLHF